MAKQPKSSKPGPVAKRAAKAPIVKPRVSVARKQAVAASAPAPEPAVLTATQALNAAAAATGEAVTPTPKPKRTYTRKVVPVPAVAKAAPEPKIAAPTDIPAVAAPLQEEKTPEPVVEAALVQAEGNAMMTDVIETTKKITDEAKAKLESAFAEFNQKAKAGVEKSTKALGELSDITKGNVEAFVESGKIAAKGVEAMGQDAAEYGRKSFEKATATMKSFASVKSPTEFFQLQSELLSTTFDAFAKETAKNSEAMLKLAGDVAQPISTRVSLVTEKVKSLAA
ncbi:phasin family protein [Sphingobium phenoxybenzoativorans]|uniref:Phasin family protein n=1 Tax=Sphingobium phenoxybenzoativorans TaxID=1592790 RepID=A0A975K829_9SPHN|nr:phasin family protein [Sphingobium phenoxybenzoativorans]QUT06485.1 phasin family protein [Sphingobium phenoxybenzoativorans]